MVLEVVAAGETLFILVLFSFYKLTLFSILFRVSVIGTRCYVSGYSGY